MPDELAESLPMIREVLDCFDIPTLEMEGYEADDIIGTLSKKAAGNNYEVGMFTGDKDCYQLVEERLSFFTRKHSNGLMKTGLKRKWAYIPTELLIC